MKLYRYLSLESDTLIERAKRLIVHREVFYPRPSEFNDPFESVFQVTTEASRGQRLLSAMKHLRHVLPSLSHVDRKTRAKSLASDHSLDDPDRVAQFVQKWNQILTQDFGILCLGEVPTEILMWSHYAAKHKGICVEFDSVEIDREPQTILAKVTYSEPLPSFNIYASSPVEKATAALLTKAKHWEYEHEWRSIYQSPKVRLRVLPPRAITAVILGLRSTANTMVAGWIAEAGQPIRLLKAVRKRTEYALEVQPVTMSAKAP